MNSKIVLAIMLLSSRVAFAGEEILVKKPVVCLATLAHWNAWKESPKGGQSPYGKYIGASNKIERFNSSNGRYLYYCDVKKDRVHIASSPVALKMQPKFNYTRKDYRHFYTVNNDTITISTKYPGGTKDEKIFSIKKLEKKF